jgi:hypothetical protein
VSVPRAAVVSSEGEIRGVSDKCQGGRMKKSTFFGKCFFSSGFVLRHPQ